MSEKASQSRKFHFTSKGGGYSAIWMGSRGDIYQEYEDLGNGSYKYYPDFSIAANNITMSLTVTSAKTKGVVSPAEVTYYANGTKLTFNGNTCTNTGWGNVFARNADGNLKIIGNLGAVFNGNFMLAADVSVSAASGSDIIHVTAPVTMPPYNGADYARVTILSPDGKNFTIEEKGGSVQLKALTTKGGTEVTSGLTYQWYKIVSGVFTLISGATSQTLTVQEADVDTYGMYKVVVKENGVELGFDTQQVLDASDPYDILISSKIFSGSGSEVSTNDLELNDDMPDNAYLLFTCTFVKRGQTAAVAGTATYVFTVMAGNGANLYHPAPLTGAANQCKVTVADIKGWGIGDYEFIVDGEIG